MAWAGITGGGKKNKKKKKRAKTVRVSDLVVIGKIGIKIYRVTV